MRIKQLITAGSKRDQIFRTGRGLVRGFCSEYAFK
jgi:hypothetical protein